MGSYSVGVTLYSVKCSLDSGRYSCTLQGDIVMQLCYGSNKCMCCGYCEGRKRGGVGVITK